MPELDLDPTVFIVDDDNLCLEFNELVLKVLGYPTKTFSSAQDFLSQCPDNPVGCLISDIVMPGMTGVELFSEVERRKITLPFIYLTGYGNIRLVRDALRAGAFDFIEKPVDPNELIGSVKLAITESKKRYLSNYKRRQFEKKLAKLTDREAQIFQLMIQGHNTSSIADGLNISVRTVETHKYRIFKKFSVDGLQEIMSSIISLTEIDLLQQ